MTLRRSKWRKALEQAPTKALRSDRKSQSDKKIKTTKAKIGGGDSSVVRAPDS